MLNEYKKLKTIGKGSFGTASLQLVNNEYVVVKEILTMDMDDEDKKSAFNEVDILSTLNHPNIIRYIESFKDEDSLKIVMEYADGGNLAQLINLKKHKNDVFTEIGILDIISQISAALSYMHSKRILHRDLKTANVFIGMNGTIKLGDFGISKMLNTKSQAHTVIGTPYYLSPEMCECNDYNAKSDIWALGCILYELASLKKPFSAQNLPVLVQKITACEYDNIPQFYSTDLSCLVSIILQKNPANRPSANEIYDVLIPKIQEKVMDNDQNQSTPENRSILYEMRNFFDEKVITPVELPHKKIISFSVSPTHSLVVTADQMVYGWGENSHGQLALGNCDPLKKYPVCASQSHLRNKHIKKCAAGQNFSLFLNSQGLIFSCGDGSKGCLGHGELSSVTDPKICNSLVTSTISDICCGLHHCVALSTEGSIFTWGLSAHGELGLGLVEQRNKPSAISLPTKIDQIFCSEDATLLLASNGKILVAGSNQYNKLGVPQKGNVRTFHTLVCNYGRIKSVSMCASRTLLVNEKGLLIILGKKSGKDQDGRNNEVVQVIKMSSKITMSTCTNRFITVADQQNVIWFWGSYERKISNEVSLNGDSSKTRNNKYNSIVSLLNENNSNVKQVLSPSTETIHIKNPKSVLAVYSSEKNIKSDNIIHISDIKARDNTVLVVVHTTTPPHTKTFNISYPGNSSSTSQDETSLAKKIPILEIQDRKY